MLTNYIIVTQHNFISGSAAHKSNRQTNKQKDGQLQLL